MHLSVGSLRVDAREEEMRDYSHIAPAMQALARERMAAAAFDTSRLVDFTERVQINLAATQLTPLVRESGRLVVTDRRLYFQPLHNVTGDSPVRVHALADVAAVARRRSSLKPTGAPPSCHPITSLPISPRGKHRASAKLSSALLHSTKSYPV